MTEKKLQAKPSDYHGTRKRVSLQGAYGEGLSMAKAVRPNVRKISADLYEVIATGEVREYKKSEGKGGKSLRQTMNRLQGLIRANFTQGDKAQGFMTLTYRENMQDPQKLYTDFVAFWKRLCYAYPQKKLEYLSVAEPQGRGAWHLHILLKDTTGANLYIDNKQLAEIWGHGYTDIQRLKGDDVGKYYVTYFTCIQDRKEDIGESGKSKAAKKSDRLKFYPKGFRFYRKSRGIVEPKTVYMSDSEFVERFPHLKSSKSYDIIDTESGETLNRIEHELRRK